MDNQEPSTSTSGDDADGSVDEPKKASSVGDRLQQAFARADDEDDERDEHEGGAHRARRLVDRESEVTLKAVVLGDGM